MSNPCTKYAVGRKISHIMEDARAAGGRKVKINK